MQPRYAHGTASEGRDVKYPGHVAMTCDLTNLMFTDEAAARAHFEGLRRLKWA
jgi:hypothetical protein